MDRLTTLLSHFTLGAGVFYTGNICGIHDFQKDILQGHIHLFKIVRHVVCTLCDSLSRYHWRYTCLLLASWWRNGSLQLKHVAYDVGYGSASALTRAFIRKLGCSPIEWLNQRQQTHRLSVPAN